MCLIYVFDRSLNGGWFGSVPIPFHSIPSPHTIPHTKGLTAEERLRAQLFMIRSQEAVNYYLKRHINLFSRGGGTGLENLGDLQSDSAEPPTDATTTSR